MIGRRWVTFGLIVGLGATVDIIWEVAEYLLQQSGQSGLQLTYANTIQDLATSLLGATIGAALVDDRPVAEAGHAADALRLVHGQV